MPSTPAEVSVTPKSDESDNVDQSSPDKDDGKKAKNNTLSAKLAKNFQKKLQKIMDQTDRAFQSFRKGLSMEMGSTKNVKEMSNENILLPSAPYPTDTGYIFNLNPQHLNT